MVTDARMQGAPKRERHAVRIVVESIFRHKRKCLALFIVIFGLTAVFTVVRKREYASSAKLYVRVGRETITVDPTAAASGQVITLNQTQDREIQSVLDLLESRALWEAVVDRVGPAEVLEPTIGEPKTIENESTSDWIGSQIARLRDTAVSWGLTVPISDREKAIRKLATSLEIGSDRNSSVISIDCKAGSPQAARRLAESFVDEFRALHLLATRATGAYEFLRKQTEDLKSQLDVASTQLRDAKIAANLVSIAGKSKVLNDQLAAFEASLMQARADLEASRARITDLEESLSNTPDRIVTSEAQGLPNMAEDDMRKQLFALQIQEAELRSRYSDENPRVIATREQVRQTKEILDAETRKTQATMDANPTHQELALALALERGSKQAHQARIEELKSQRAEILHELHVLDEQEVTISDLERRVELCDGAYRDAIRRHEQSRIGQELKANGISNINVVEAPTLIERPVDWGPLLLLALGGIVAISGAICLAVGCEISSDRIRTTEEAEVSLGLPVFPILPRQRPPRVRVAPSKLESKR